MQLGLKINTELGKSMKACEEEWRDLALPESRAADCGTSGSSRSARRSARR